MAHLYRNGTNYHVQLYVGGRRRRFSLKTDNYGIARDKVRKLEADLIHGDLERPTQTPCSELAAKFSEYLRGKARPGSSSPQTDLYRLREFLGPICPELKDNPRVRRGQTIVKSDDRRHRDKVCRRYQFAVKIHYVEEVDSQLISTFLIRICQSRGLSAKSYNEYREVIFRFFSWALKTQGIRMQRSMHTNPCEAVPRRRLPSPEIIFLSLQDIAQQFAALDQTPQLKAMVATFIYAGLRREEALWLTPNDVDLQRGVIHIRAKTINGEQWWPKTRRNRSVPISKALAAHLAAYVPRANCPWYFPSPRGFRWECTDFSHKLAAVNRKKGLNWSCLQYRHTFGSQLAMKGESLYKIAVLMGNSPEICQRHYACLLPESLVGCVEFDQMDSTPAPVSNAVACN